MQYTQADLTALADAIYAEARGEKRRGQRAVAHTIVNRATVGGRSIVDTAYARAQYSGLQPGEVNRRALERVSPTDPAYRSALSVARDVLTGKSIDPTNGATYYHTTAISPHWSTADGFVDVATIGSHKFYTAPAREVRAAARRPSVSPIARSDEFVAEAATAAGVDLTALTAEPVAFNDFGDVAVTPATAPDVRGRSFTDYAAGLDFASAKTRQQFDDLAGPGKQLGDAYQRSLEVMAEMGYDVPGKTTVTSAYRTYQTDRRTHPTGLALDVRTIDMTDAQKRSAALAAIGAGAKGIAMFGNDKIGLGKVAPHLHMDMVGAFNPLGSDFKRAMPDAVQAMKDGISYADLQGAIVKAKDENIRLVDGSITADYIRNGVISGTKPRRQPNMGPIPGREVPAPARERLAEGPSGRAIVNRRTLAPAGPVGRAVVNRNTVAPSGPGSRSVVNRRTEAPAGPSSRAVVNRDTEAPNGPLGRSVVNRRTEAPSGPGSRPYNGRDLYAPNGAPTRWNNGTRDPVAELGDLVGPAGPPSRATVNRGSYAPEGPSSRPAVNRGSYAPSGPSSRAVVTRATEAPNGPPSRAVVNRDTVAPAGPSSRPNNGRVSMSGGPAAYTGLASAPPSAGPAAYTGRASAPPSAGPAAYTGLASAPPARPMVVETATRARPAIPDQVPARSQPPRQVRSIPVMPSAPAPRPPAAPAPIGALPPARPELTSIGNIAGGLLGGVLIGGGPIGVKVGSWLGNMVAPQAIRHIAEKFISPDPKMAAAVEAGWSAPGGALNAPFDSNRYWKELANQGYDTTSAFGWSMAAGGEQAQRKAAGQKTWGDAFSRTEALARIAGTPQGSSSPRPNVGGTPQAAAAKAVEAVRENRNYVSASPSRSTIDTEDQNGGGIWSTLSSWLGADRADPYANGGGFGISFGNGGNGGSDPYANGGGFGVSWK